MKKKLAICLIAMLLWNAPFLIPAASYKTINPSDYNYDLFRFRTYDMSAGLSLGFSDNLNIGGCIKFNFTNIPFWSLKVDASIMPINKMLFFEETGFGYNFYFERLPFLSIFIGPSMGFLIKNSNSYFGFGAEAGADFYINEPKSTSVFLDLSFLS